MAIELTGWINEDGKLEIDLPAGLPPGTVVHVTIQPTDPDQAWFWTPEWQAGEREAADELARGEVETFDDGEEFLRDLADRAGTTVDDLR